MGILDLFSWMEASEASKTARNSMKKLALDFDGTIADTNAMKSILIREKLGLDIPASFTTIRASRRRELCGLP